MYLETMHPTLRMYEEERKSTYFEISHFPWDNLVSMPVDVPL